MIPVLAWPHSVNIKDIKITFSQNVLFVGRFYVENSQSQKKNFFQQSHMIIETETNIMFLL